MNTPRLPGETHWEVADLRSLRLQAEEFGLRFEAIENVPIHFYDKAMLGLPGRDEQIEHYRTTIRNMGQAGIPILGYHWMPNSVWRTPMAKGRGGAMVTAFDMALVGGSPAEQRAFVAKRDERMAAIAIAEDESSVVGEATMWANYEYFVNAVLPVAEESGVKLALHPDDPPVEMLGGVARLFRNVDGFQRALAIAGDSEAWGLDLCLGCCSEMPGGPANVREMIEFFGPRGKILYVHFRDVQGTVPTFQECFIGEGNYDPAEIIRLLHRSGFTGFLLDDHVPHMVDDTPWAHRGRAHAIGYMQGLLRMLETE
jgi:mannonate dehydratase